MKEGRLEKKTVTDKPTVRFLGATLQNNQSWQQHLVGGTKAVFSSVKKQIGALYYLRDKLPRKGRLLMANSFVLGRLIYLLPLWGSAAKNHIQKGQTVMNWAARFVTKSGKKNKDDGPHEDVWMALP